MPGLPYIPSVTYLSQRGYAIDINNNGAVVSYLKDMCTVKPYVNPNVPGASNVATFPVFKESSKKLYIPRALGLELMGPPKIDTIPHGMDILSLSFSGSLRPEQETPVKAFIDAATDPHKRGGIISIACGGGKTTISLYIAAMLKKKTLVVCHKEFLINQWRERIKQFLPGASVGLIKAKVIDVEGKDIVLASLQSLAMKDYDQHIFANFGFVVIDEVHHTSAQVFSQALPKITARVMLGLSATLERKDGLRKVFEWHLGRPVFISKAKSNKDTTIQMVKIPPKSSASSSEILMRNGKLNFVAMMNSLCADVQRTDIIVDALRKLLEKEPGRCVLILSDRKAHLKELEIKIANLGFGPIGYYIGGMKEDALAKSAQCKIILGTNMMAAEGMDIPSLNTLVLATPSSNVEQQLGRIQRQTPEERTFAPYTIDIWDTFSIFENQGVRRKAFYKKCKYDIDEKPL